MSEALTSKQNLADKLREVYSELGQHYGYIGVLELAADEIDRLTRRNAKLVKALQRIGNPNFIYSSDDDNDTQLDLRMADARAALKESAT